MKKPKVHKEKDISLKYIESDDLDKYSDMNLYTLKVITNKAGISVKQVLEKKTKKVLGIIIGGTDPAVKTNRLGIFVK